jgi:hypothetical protein
MPPHPGPSTAMVLLGDLTLWFGWSDEKYIWEAIETIDPLNVSTRLRPMVINGFDGDGWLRISDLRKIAKEGRDECVVINPRPNLDRALSQIAADCRDDPWVNVLGVGRLIVYHHCIRRKGGHHSEIEHWSDRLRACGFQTVGALLAELHSPRVFFLLDRYASQNHIDLVQ